MGVFRKITERSIGKVEDGWYFAVVKGVRVVNGRYGDRLEVRFQIFNTDIERRGWMDTWVGQKNLTRKFVAALGLLDKFDEVEEKDMIGKIVEIELKTVESNGKTFQKVVDIRGVKV
jgi:flagellar hook assembly protein FlgD